MEEYNTSYKYEVFLPSHKYQNWGRLNLQAQVLEETNMQRNISNNILYKQLTVSTEFLKLLENFHSEEICKLKEISELD